MPSPAKKPRTPTGQFKKVPVHHDPVTLSVHKTRVMARRRERHVQELLDTGHTTSLLDEYTILTLAKNPWIKGAKVNHAGRFQHQVQGTQNKGQ